MTHPHLELGLPVGAPVPGWHPPPRPPRTPLTGRHCRLEPADPARHAADLHAANARDAEGRMWVYLAYGPFATEEDYRRWLASSVAGDDPVFYAVIDAATGRAVGLASFLRIDPANGVIEVGHLAFSPALQRTVAATEAIFLMMRWVFESGYRRFEWKCNALNEPSRRAAQRFGFSYEGTFRQAVISKGRNRDTAWYAMIDAEWPALSAAYGRWLADGNFDPAGRQRVALGELTGPVLKSRG
ncbi:MAG: GNAT family N-acetyltransferase [Proteobacteria bacterium]|nr:GNAT family N-acetyltransferase [Pseudomonadota bacterium]